MRLIEGSQEAVRAKWPLIRIRSGDEGVPFGGSRVGESSFRRQRGLPSMASAMLTPLATARSSRDTENQAGWWAISRTSASSKGAR